MSANDTMRLELPLLQPAQAQKHVTVNEALMRLDGMVNLVLQSCQSATPPPVVVDGQCWGVPAGGLGDWAGQDGRIAIGLNGGWVFLPPSQGMRAFVVDQGVQAIHDGSGWAAGLISMGSAGSGMIAGLVEEEVTLGTGTSFDTGVMIPARAMVIGAVARVTEALGGTLSGWSLGTEGAEDRFGSGYGTAAGSWAHGMLGSPMTYYSAAPLKMTAEGGGFDGGKVRLAVHWLALRLPV